MIRLYKIAVCAVFSLTWVTSTVFAEEYLSGIEWQEPGVVQPGNNGAPPSDAVILFNGTDLSSWENGDHWKLEEGNMVVGKGDVQSKEAFGDCQLHIEWSAPVPATGTGQKRGNSGLFLMNTYEIQILDSFQNKTYFDGQAGAIYKQTPPQVNAMRPPGEWNVYDIIWTAPRFEKDGALRSPAYMTALHNGVLVLNHFELLGDTPYHRAPTYTAHPDRLPIRLQDHGNPIRFRNIWVREIKSAPGQRVRSPYLRDPDGTERSLQPPAGFVSLFNGKDLTSWKGLVANPKKRSAMSGDELARAQVEADERMRAHWKVVDGVLEFDGEGDNLCTAKDYGDFEMYVDWKILPGGDSGIYLRGSPQVQIWDTAHEPYHKLGADKGSGAFWNNQTHARFPLMNADNPAGEWNTFHIRMIGERVTIRLNGKLVTDHVVMENFWERDKPIYPRGQIELQNHGNKLWFRNIYIREITAEEANAELSRIDADRFQPIFNGMDLSGWQGATDSYEIKDGTLVCKPGQHGNLFTEKTYSNFVVQTEFLLPPAGNNGLAIRYSGDGNPHTHGMAEIQILDSEHPQYANLDSRQYHGSVYGLVPAPRGYLRPVGQWNHQRVTALGSRIKVELNGFTIVNADLNQVKKSKDGEVYPSASTSKGFFGFAGHNDPVAFRNIEIWDFTRQTVANKSPPRSPIEERIPLFNGHNLEGLYTWMSDVGYEDPREVFSVVDDMLRVSGDGYGGITTQFPYRDYHMIIEFKWGELTWGARKEATRDSGLLVHCHGPDGNFGQHWMASVEAQIIEGGCGDLLVLSGQHPTTGETLVSSVTAEIQRDRDGEMVWHRGGERKTTHGGRINWWGRDVDWVDKLGFRGKEDVESPHGEWTRMDVISDGGHLIYKVNGVVVNEAFDVTPDNGRILLQTEGAELFVRRWELWPLEKAPE